MKKDEVFNKPIEKQFEFDAEIAAVFDDMLQRSVPFYGEAMKLTQRFAKNYLSEGGLAYDLGCSTATTLLDVERSLEVEARLIGLDNAPSMLEHAQKKIIAFNSKVEVQEADIMSFDYEPCDVVISNYTLQFIRPLVREELIKKISGVMNKGGAFIFSEKVVSADSKLNKELIDCYYDFKQTQGYSQYEIAQKREALENVLIPYSEAENIEMAQRCGFSHCECIFRWANFATFIAIK